MEIGGLKEIFDEMNAIKCCRNDLKRKISEFNKIVNEYKIVSLIPYIKKSNEEMIKTSLETCSRLESYIDVLMDLVDYKRGKELTAAQINEIREVLSKKTTFKELRGDVAISLLEIIAIEDSKHDSLLVKKQKTHNIIH